MEPGGTAADPEIERWLADRHLSLPSDDGERAEDEGRAQPYPPFLWRWADIHEALTRIGPALDTDPELARRMAGYKHFGFGHPGMPAGVSSTVNMGAQVLTPGEHGEARRHLQAEFRFIVKGAPGAYAVVEGERFPMETGDLLGTPAWAWYDWANDGDEPVFWLNMGDLTLTRLAYRFREVHPAYSQPIDKPSGYWERAAAHGSDPLPPGGGGLGRGGTGPRSREDRDMLPTPPFRYPWIQVAEALETLQASGEEPDPVDGYRFVYPHPLTGGPTSPTLAFEAQLLPPGFATQSRRQTCTTRYHVVQGQGTTIVGNERLDWTDQDCFVVPPWAWHRHENAAGRDAILFSATDRPIVDALELYREEREGR